MSSTTRRAFIADSFVGASAAWTLNAAPLRKSNLGVQLYTVRDIVGKDPARVLKAIQDIGYAEVEVTYANFDAIEPGLKQTQLKAVSAHLDLAVFRQGGDRLNQALENLQTHKFEYVVVPYVPPEERGGAEMFNSFADLLNKSAEAAKSHRLKLAYHNHAFEFAPQGNTTGLEILMAKTDKNLVGLELDIFWASVAGHSPVDMLHNYAGRIPLLHLKDKAAGFATQYNESVPGTTFKEIGSGSIDIAAVLKAANSAGVRHYFVEQDQTPGDPIDSLRTSYEYLSKLFGS